MSLSLFDYLFLSHFVGDYVLQNGWQALNKAKGRFMNLPLITHCIMYTLSFVPAFWNYGVSAWWLVLIFGSHMIIDRRWPIIMFLKLKEGKLHDNTFEPPFWLVIMIDQIVHILILAIIATLH